MKRRSTVQQIIVCCYVDCCHSNDHITDDGTTTYISSSNIGSTVLYNYSAYISTQNYYDGYHRLIVSFLSAARLMRL